MGLLSMLKSLHPHTSSLFVLLLSQPDLVEAGALDRFFGSWSPRALRGGPDIGFPEPPDTRPSACRSRSFESVGPNASVSIIIPYLHESWDHFRQTMRSILHYTPDALLKEFILVSDGNPPELTYEDELKNMSPKVIVLKNEQRRGLIKTKMKGVNNATGEVLVFMEAHCRVNRDWLQPLLARLAESPRALVQPTLDIIPQDHFAGYYGGTEGHWRFEWNMNLIFTSPPEPSKEASEPRPSPATSGGIFAIRRDWWMQLGFYDPEMLEWGGDHVEATMKVWRCGGHIDVHPCSRVGHLFRDTKHRPYNVEVNTVVHNYARLAKVWWDDYLPQFYRVKPEAKSFDTGNISAQIRLREKLGCKDMSWYLRNVDVEMEWEATRICIPGALKQHGGCDRRRPARGRSTVDHTMPDAEYAQRRAEVLARLREDSVVSAHEL